MPLEHKHYFICRCFVKHPIGLCSVLFYRIILFDHVLCDSSGVRRPLQALEREGAM